MSEHVQNIDWPRLAADTESAVEPLWEAICARLGDNDDPQTNGYRLLNQGFKNYPPRMAIDAAMIIPENSNTNIEEAQKTLAHIAKEHFAEDNVLITVHPHFPFVGSIAKDPSFGTEPEHTKPPSATLLFSLNRKKYTK